MTGVIQLLGRTMLALIFILAGVGKIMDPAGTTSYMQSMGVPGILLWPSIAFELIAGVCLVIGYKTRWAAISLAIFSLVTAVIFHRNFAEGVEMYLFLKNIAMAGGLLLLAVGGRTAFCVDNRRSQTDFFGTRFEKH
jgi:putative oxidoreductase